MKFGIIVYPGSNCDEDCYYCLKSVFGMEVKYIWHRETSLGNVDGVILPGGFSYGDYLRTGAMAKFSPIMPAVNDFAKGGGNILGICNGFQILLESGLLPGAMLRNKDLHFICRHVSLTVASPKTRFTEKCPKNKILRIPIAHNEGSYFIDPQGLAKLKTNNQIVFRYAEADGTLTDGANPNGSVDNIAGIINEKGNVLGMMPHPERCAEKLFPSSDGTYIFESLLAWFEKNSYKNTHKVEAYENHL